MNRSEIPAEELVRLCIERRESSDWQEFLRRFHPLIQRTVVRVARRWGEDSSQVYDDLIQDTYLKLCHEDFRILRQFDFRHPDSVYGYLKVIAANVVQDHFRAEYAEKRGAGQRHETLETQEASIRRGGESSAEAIERAVLIQQINLMLCEDDSEPESKRNRRIFWLYYRQGLTAQAIASLPSVGLSVKGVESTIHRMTRNVRLRMVERPSTTTGSSVASTGIQAGKPLLNREEP